jgi:hypothetical protein
MMPTETLARDVRELLELWKCAHRTAPVLAIRPCVTLADRPEE